MRNTYLQFIQFITGAVIAILLGIHIVYMHLDAILSFFGVDVAESTSFDSMMERSGQGIWAALYIALLIFGLYHALNGLRGIILELTSSPVTGRIVTWVIVVVGIVFLILGIYAPLALLSV